MLNNLTESKGNRLRDRESWSREEKMETKKNNQRRRKTRIMKKGEIQKMSPQEMRTDNWYGGLSQNLSSKL